MLHLGHLLAPLVDYQPRGSEPDLSGAVVDSREVKRGSLFVALEGERHDGHDFVADAFDRGAVAALVERQVVPGTLTIDTTGDAPIVPETIAPPVQVVVDDTVAAMHRVASAWLERCQVRVIGITGSVGKTSTKELTYAVLAQRYRTFKSPGNRNSVLGLPPALLDLRPAHERAVLEMGMYVPGEIRQLCQMTNPAVGVVTMIDPVHMERAGSLEAIVAAKRELVEALPPDGVALHTREVDVARIVKRIKSG